MVEAIKEFRYKTAGRGRGILGITDFGKCRQPLCSPRGLSGLEGEKGDGTSRSKPPPLDEGTATPREDDAPPAPLSKLVVALFDYKADPSCPGGFKELSLNKGQLLEYLGEHPSNEHWWRVKSEDGELGFVPASYAVIKDDQVLPWLQYSALKSEEEDRKERVMRLKREKDSQEGKGFGPPPKQLPAKPYVSSYDRNSGQVKQGPSSYYCEVCEKSFNGPKPYSAHMASRAHREEVEVQAELRR